MQTTLGIEVVVLFGGVDTFSFTFFNDMWGLRDGGQLWSQVCGFPGAT
jgi:hypothetical protein